MFSRFDFGGQRGRLSERSQSIATIRTGVGATRFYVIRASPEPPHASQFHANGLHPFATASMRPVSPVAVVFGRNPRGLGPRRYRSN